MRATDLRLWVSDAHPIFRAGLAASLREAQMRVVWESDKVEDDPATTWDVVIFDANPPHQRLAAALVLGPKVAMIDDAGIAEIDQILAIGIDGLLLRDRLSPRKLSAAINAAASGAWSCPSDIVERLLDGGRSGGSGLLTSREKDVLILLGDGYSTAEIADRLAYSQRTIKNHVQSILTKLNCRNRAHAVGVAAREGMI